MLSFAVYQDGSLATEYPLHHGHLLGPDDIGIQGDVSVADGHIVCEKRSVESAALCLLADLGDRGNVMLQTCLLPERDEPYLLHVELARHRIKTFLVKLEDWQLFELDISHPVLRAFDEARTQFMEAILTADINPAEADRLGRESLLLGMEAGEKLAMMHADALLAQRYATSLMPEVTLGCQVYHSQFAEPLTRIVGASFDFLSMPLRWKEVEPEEGRYDWSKIDRWMDWARGCNFKVMAGPIIDFRPLSVPEWLYIWEHDYDTTQDLLYEHIEAIVERYRDVVSVWNVASSLHINDNFRLSYDQLTDVTRLATSLLKNLHPEGQTLIEITEPFGEYYAANPKSIPPIIYAENLAQEGLKLDYIGVTIETGHHRRGMATRDLLQLSSLLDRLVHLELPIIVSALAVPSHRPKMDDRDPAGWWKQEWAPPIQGEWLSKLTAIALSKPFVESVCVRELYDHPASELPAAGMITGTGRAKPSLGRINAAYRDIKRGTLRCSAPEEREWTITTLPDPESASSQ